MHFLQPEPLDIRATTAPLRLEANPSQPIPPVPLLILLPIANTTGFHTCNTNAHPCGGTVVYMMGGFYYKYKL